MTKMRRMIKEAQRKCEDRYGSASSTNIAEYIRKTSGTIVSPVTIEAKRCPK